LLFFNVVSFSFLWSNWAQIKWLGGWPGYFK